MHQHSCPFTKARRLVQPLLLSAAIGLVACDSGNHSTDAASVLEQASMTASADFSPRPKEPRIPPVGEDRSGLSDAQIAMLNSRPDYNLYKTLVHHVDLYNHWSPLGRVLLNASTLPARDREIIMLRMGWLCQAEYEWAQHARIASAPDIGMTAEEIHRIAADPDSNEWTELERSLMDMVDELRYDAMISDATWQALRQHYSEQEVMDALFTAAQYQLVSMVLNSVGIQLDPELDFRLPADLPKPALAKRPKTTPLDQSRIAPLHLEDMTEQQRSLVQAHLSANGGLSNLYATLINHTELYGPRATFGRYIMSGSSLPALTRELLVLRTSWLTNAEYLWAHHLPFARQAGLSEEQIQAVASGSDASLWNEEERTVLRAAEELRREAFIRDDTWRTLERYYDPKQLVEIVFTVGGYTMTALAANSFGVQLEEGYAGFPDL